MAENITFYEKMSRVETQVENILDSQNDIKSSVKEIQSSIQTMTVQNDMRYASKSTETTLNAGIGIILTSVILAILALVFKRRQ